MMKFSKCLFLFILAMTFLGTAAHANHGAAFSVFVSNHLPSDYLSVSVVVGNPDLDCIAYPAKRSFRVPFQTTSEPIVNITEVSYDYCKPYTDKHISYDFTAIGKNGETLSSGRFSCHLQEMSNKRWCTQTNGNALVKSITKSDGNVYIDVLPQ